MTEQWRTHTHTHMLEEEGGLIWMGGMGSVVLE